MDRRNFASRLLAAGAAGNLFATGPAMANDEPKSGGDRNSNGFAGHGRVELRTINQVIIPVKLILVLRESAEQFGIDLRLNMPRRNENRVGLLTPTLGRQFRGAREVGGIRLWGNSLIATVDNTLMPDVLHLLNRSVSFLIRTARLARTDATRLPALGTLPYLGRIFHQNIASRESDELLVFVTPTILDDRL